MQTSTPRMPVDTLDFVKVTEAAALAAKQRAEEAVASRGDKVQIAEAQAELVRAVAQLRAIERLRKKR